MSTEEDRITLRNIPVQIIEVNTVNTEPTQRLLRSLGNVVRISNNGLASGLHVEAKLGRDEDLVPLPGPLEPESAG